MCVISKKLLFNMLYYIYIYILNLLKLRNISNLNVTATLLLQVQVILPTKPVQMKLVETKLQLTMRVYLMGTEKQEQTMKVYLMGTNLHLQEDTPSLSKTPCLKCKTLVTILQH